VVTRRAATVIGRDIVCLTPDAVRGQATGERAEPSRVGPLPPDLLVFR
jgi:hypothetical protein